jgi:hypothetical protein
VRYGYLLPAVCFVCIALYAALFSKPRVGDMDGAAA